MAVGTAPMGAGADPIAQRLAASRLRSLMTPHSQATRVFHRKASLRPEWSASSYGGRQAVSRDSPSVMCLS